MYQLQSCLGLCLLETTQKGKTTETLCQKQFRDHLKVFLVFIVITLCVAGLENVEERINRQGNNGERLDIFQFINDINDKQENIAF